MLSGKAEAIFKAIANGDAGVLNDFVSHASREEIQAVFAEINTALKEFYDYTLQLSQGMLSVTPPQRKIFIDAGVKQLHTRLNNLVSQLTQVSQGDYEQKSDCMGELSEGFNWMTSQLRLREAQFAYELDHDVLTGLLNRDAFKRKAYDLITGRPDREGVMLFARLKHLKYVNDFYGHEAGDRYIAAAAQIFAAFRKMGALAARISGNEFAVYLHDLESKEETRRTISNLLSHEGQKSIALPQNRVQKIRFSAGLSWYPDDTQNVAELIKFADYAMYESVRDDREFFVEFDREVHLTKINQLEKWESINKLIEERLIRFAFQPILDARDGSLYGYEALMRSRMEDFSSPVEILAVASSQFLLPQIEKMTLSLILNWLRENVSRLGGRKLFVNSIPDYLLSGEERDRLQENYGDLLPHIVFEITEGAAESEEELMEKASYIQTEFGAMIALDDYGSGYSGEMRLLNLNPDIVKIDRSFITGIHLDKNRQVLLFNLISFCRSKDIRVLAEGVENAEDLKTLIDLDVDLLQGYFLARPDFDLRPIDAEKRALLERLNGNR